MLTTEERSWLQSWIDDSPGTARYTTDVTKRCRVCLGTGEIEDPEHPMHPNQTGDGPEETWCLECDGTGEIEDEEKGGE